MAFNNVFDSSLVDYSKDFEQQDEKAQLIEKYANKILDIITDNSNDINNIRECLDILKIAVSAVCSAIEKKWCRRWYC